MNKFTRDLILEKSWNVAVKEYNNIIIKKNHGGFNFYKSCEFQRNFDVIIKVFSIVYHNLYEIFIIILMKLPS